MKIDQLITQYLYQHKKLSLPGIGTFTSGDSGIQFDNVADSVISDDLIDYIRSNTGKMRSLAISDLESYIMLNKQFLNIGKPLHMEGIGTLVKTREGLFDFTPGEMITERVEDLQGTENRKVSAFSDSSRYEPQPNALRKWLLALVGVVTLGIIIWAGWKLSQGDEPPMSTAPVASGETDSISLAKPDTGLSLVLDSNTSSLPLAGKTDTGLAVPVSTPPPPGSWKFVIEETSNKNRALKRFGQLKDMRKNILLETPDSVRFRLYFLLPAAVSDTARIKDSLRIYYASRRVLVEKP